MSELTAAQRAQAEQVRQMKAERSARYAAINKEAATRGDVPNAPFVTGGRIDILKGSGKHYGGYGH